MCIFSVFINDAGPAFLVGFLAHIIPDMLTSHGIKLFWPFADGKISDNMFDRIGR